MKLDLKGSAPQLVATILTPAGLKKITKPLPGPDLVEVRVDALLQAHTPLAVIQDALERRTLPVLLTCRSVNEGGRFPWKKGDRVAVFHALLPDVDAVDIELASRIELKSVLSAARAARKKIILSAHAIGKPISPATLKKWATALKKEKPDIAKIAAHIGSQTDLRALASILLEDGPQRWAVMGLGPQAALSRQLFAALGSALVYGYLDQPAAPGQPSAAEVGRFLDDYLAWI